MGIECVKGIKLVTLLALFFIMVMDKKTDAGENVRLVYGNDRYEGKVQMYRNETGWTPVCYWKSDWIDGNVVCQELGRPGAMYSGSAHRFLVDDDRQRVIDVACIGNESSIADCYYNMHPNCPNSAVVKCNFDGYKGCFASDEDGVVLPGDEFELDDMTIQRCLSYCRGVGKPYAGLRNATYCYCGSDEASYWGDTESWDKCGTRCDGDSSSVCGGEKHVSVYSTNIGACGGSITEPATIYSPGYPGNISADAACFWNIHLTETNSVKLNFILMEPAETLDSQLRIFENFHGGLFELSVDGAVVTSCSSEVFMFSRSSQETGRKFVIEVTDLHSDCTFPADVGTTKNFDMSHTCPFYAGDNISISCHPGYNLTTTHNTVTCQENGAWSDTFPNCTAVDCGDPGSVQNADREGTSFTYSSKVQYTCQDGYAGGGDITCTEDATWTDKSPCRQIGCGDPGTVENADKDGDDHTYNGTVVYSCQEGYYSNENNTILCQENGEWTTKPECLKIGCGNPGVVENAEHIGNMSLDNDTLVYYYCLEGYQNKESVVVICEEGEVWKEKPACSKIDDVKPTQEVGSSKSRLGAGVIVAIILVILAALLLIIILVIIICKRKSKKKYDVDVGEKEMQTTAVQTSDE